MRALVTGATGFVGSHLVEALVARGDDVLAMARRPEGRALVERLGATPVAGSLEDARSLEAAVAGADVVYHVAGLTAARSGEEYFAVNEQGTRRLAAAVRRAAPGVSRLVYVSSQAAVGPGRLVAEDVPCRPVSAYGESKLAGERLIAESDLPWTIVRPPSVYGPRDRAFLPLFKLAARGIAPVFGSGDQELSLIYAPDLALALIAAGTAPRASGRVYHLAHPALVRSRELALAVGHAVGRRPLVVAVPRVVAALAIRAAATLRRATGRRSVVNPGKLDEFFAPAWTLDVSRAGRELGWSAGTDVATGTRLTAAWYRSEGWM